MKNYYLIILVCFNLSCSSERERAFDDFIDLTTLGKEKLRDWYISDASDMEFVQPNAMKYSGFSGVILSNQYFNSNTFERDSILLVENNKLKFTFSDELLFIGDSYFENQFNENRIPIPSLKCDFCTMKKYEVSEKSLFIVIEYSYQYSFKNMYSTKPLNLPSKYKNGYSIGVVLTNDKRILRWLILW